MPVDFVCPGAPVTDGEVEGLWRTVVDVAGFTDDDVAVRCVGEGEIRELNGRYRGKDKATNVLTFSYGKGEHDVAVCLEVANKESEELGLSRKDYFAWLLTHAFLHAVGLDHEKSEEEARRMAQAEGEILERNGFKQNRVY